MTKIVHVAPIALAMAVAGCASSLPGASLVTDADGSKTVLITDSPGGNIDAFDAAFSNWSRIPGVKVEIVRWCASACTQVLGHFPPEQVCLSPGARVGFHSTTRRAVYAAQTSNGRGVSAAPPDIDSISTLLMFAAYPTWVQHRLSGAGVMGLVGANPSATIGANEFWYHGYRVCPTATQTAARDVRREGS